MSSHVNKAAGMYQGRKNREAIAMIRAKPRIIRLNRTNDGLRPCFANSWPTPIKWWKHLCVAALNVGDPLNQMTASGS